MDDPKIIFEDQHLIVLSKPAGLLSQGEESGVDNLVTWLQKYVGRNYIGLVHRLDRNTSGLMVVGKRTKAAGRLSEALRTGKLDRLYVAWIEGRLPANATWRHFLSKDGDENLVSVVREGTAGAKVAELVATPLRQSLNRGTIFTLAEFKLLTGRSHQIRAQAAAMGHPVLGDKKYGGRSFTRLALHSHKISFPHPMSAEVMHFEDPLPSDLEL